LKLSSLSNTFEFIYSAYFLESVNRQARLTTTACARECQETRFGKHRFTLTIARSRPMKMVSWIGRLCDTSFTYSGKI